MELFTFIAKFTLFITTSYIYIHSYIISHVHDQLISHSVSLQPRLQKEIDLKEEVLEGLKASLEDLEDELRLLQDSSSNKQEQKDEIKELKASLEGRWLCYGCTMVLQGIMVARWSWCLVTELLWWSSEVEAMVGMTLAMTIGAVGETVMVRRVVQHGCVVLGCCGGCCDGEDDGTSWLSGVGCCVVIVVIKMVMVSVVVMVKMVNGVNTWMDES
ncbi:hypothetical protein QVD17_06859 [Tagetes erecta]|uniref:Uncharacterized protein n=1 Tax=Tagetes erecta TaxID=13708 RepID=A0AAD8LK73_TARER|nr:hypothetical protein QVD17_06859 [Tagetes erecta]